MDLKPPPSPNEVVYHFFEYTGIWDLTGEPSKPADNNNKIALAPSKTIKKHLEQSKDNGRSLSLEEVEEYIFNVCSNRLKPSQIEALFIGLKRFLDLYKTSMVFLSKKTGGKIPPAESFLSDVLAPALCLSVIQARAAYVAFEQSNNTSSDNGMWWLRELGMHGAEKRSPVNRVAQLWFERKDNNRSSKLTAETIESWKTDSKVIPRVNYIEDEFESKPEWLMRMIMARGMTSLLKWIEQTYPDISAIVFEDACRTIMPNLDRLWPILLSYLGNLPEKQNKEIREGCWTLFDSVILPNKKELSCSCFINASDAIKQQPATNLDCKDLDEEARSFLAKGEWSKALECYTGVIDSEKFKKIYWAAVSHICSDAIGLSCWLYLNKADLNYHSEKSPWVIAKQFRSLAQSFGVGEKLERRNDKAYQETSAAHFIQKFDGVHPKIKASVKYSCTIAGRDVLTQTDSLLDCELDLKNPNKCVQIPGRSKVSQIMYAVVRMHIDWIDPLIEAGADLNYLDGDGQSIFHFVMRNFYLDSQRYEVAEKLLRVTGERAMRAEVLDSCSAKSRNNALSFAIAECQVTLVERLLDRGCDVNTRVLAEGIPLLCLAISNVASHLIDPEATAAARNIVDKLLRHEKIKLFAKMADGRSALSLATEFHLPSIVQFLVTHGADVNERRLDGVTPLSCAVYNDDIELTQILIDGGAYCDTVLPNGQLLLSMTRNKVIKNLLEDGISRGQTRSTII